MLSLSLARALSLARLPASRCWRSVVSAMACFSSAAPRIRSLGLVSAIRLDEIRSLCLSRSLSLARASPAYAAFSQIITKPIRTELNLNAQSLTKPRRTRLVSSSLD